MKRKRLQESADDGVPHVGRGRAGGLEEDFTGPGVAAERTFNFLSDLPDLVLCALIDFLQPGGAPPLPDHDTPEASLRMRAFHSAFESDVEFRHMYEQQSEEPSEEEWAAYLEELRSRPRPLAHVPYETLTGMGMEVVPGVSPSLLALRLTCRSVKWSIEAVAHHRLFPPFELFTRVRWPALLFVTSPQDAEDQHCIREFERVAVGCANARLLQLRMTGGRESASVAQRLNCDRYPRHEKTGDSAGTAERGRLRVDYVMHESDFLGRDAGVGVESCLTLSLPGQPQEEIQILCSAEVVSNDSRDSRNVLLDLHTSSSAWIQTLGLEKHQTSDATATTASVVTMPLFTWNSNSAFSESHQEVFLLLWQALGFAIPADATEELEEDVDPVVPDTKTVWALDDAVALVSTFLGWDKLHCQLPGAWTQQRPFVPRSLRLAERHAHRSALLREVEAFFTDQIDPILAPLDRQRQLRGLRSVIFSIGRFFGQRRIAMAGQALASVRAVRPKIVGHPMGKFQPVEATQEFFESLRFLHGRSFSVEFDEDAFTSSSVRFCIPFPCEETSQTLDGAKRRTVEPESGSPRAAAARLWVAYDHKHATKDLSSPRAWLERLAVRVITADDHHPLQIEFGAAEHEIFRSQYIVYAEPTCDALETETLVRLGHLLRLQPSSSSTSSEDNASRPGEEFAVDVARLLVMVAKVAMHDAEQTFPVAEAYNQQLVHNIDHLIDAPEATADVPEATANVPADSQPQPQSSAQPPPRTTQQATEFVRDFVLLPWPT